MPTVFRLTHEGPTFDVDVEKFRSMLAREIAIESRDDGLYAVVASTGSEDSLTQALIERELDRLFFLTCVRLRAEMCRSTVTADLAIKYRIHRKIPEGTAPLTWTDKLALQLKFWSLAADTTDQMARVILLYQIIELKYPDLNDKCAYPPYKDEKTPLSPRTEAKLLRNIVAHAGDARPETASYLRFLGLPTSLSNLTHPDWIKVLSNRLPIVEMEARKVLRYAA